MAIPGNKTTVVVIPVDLLQMRDTCGSLSSPRIHISVVTTFLKADIQSFPISTFMVQNTGSTQEKYILPKILPFTK